MSEDRQQDGRLQLEGAVMLFTELRDVQPGLTLEQVQQDLRMYEKEVEDLYFKFDAQQQTNLLR